MRPLNISANFALNYYYEQDPLLSVSCWFGKVAQKLGIEGRLVEKHVFANILSGNNTKGKQIVADGVNKDGEKEHRAAVDIPFTAPKSVSILALHGDDKRLIEAHEQAVKETIFFIENKFLYCRKKENYISHKIKTGKGIFCTFNHSVSRHLDPHFHTHCLVMNITYSDRYQAMINDFLFKHQRLITNIYQAELSRRVRNLGYAIDPKGDGFFEISGVRQEWLDIFNKSTKKINQIEQEMHKDGKLPDACDAALRDQAAVDARIKKGKISEQELRVRWEKELPKRELFNSVKQHLKPPTKPVPGDRKKVIALATDIIHEVEACFTKFDLLDASLRLCRGKFVYSDIWRGIEKLIQQGSIIKIRQVDDKGVIDIEYSTKPFKQLERSLTRDFINGRDQQQPILDKATIQKFIRKSFNFFTKGQKLAVETILSTPHQFLLIQGDSGTGKTLCLQAVKDILEKAYSNAQVKGFAFTGKAVKELNSVGIESQTIHRFLFSKNQKIDTPEIWLVDESSMVGSRQMRSILDRAIEQKAQVVFIGDKYQLLSIQAGKPFRDLQKLNKVPLVEINEVIRQRTQYAKEVVEKIKSYQRGCELEGINQAFSILKKTNCLHVEKTSPLLNTMAENYGEEYRKGIDVFAITSVNQDKDILNQRFRQTIKEMGLLQGEEHTFAIKIPESLLGIKQFFAENFSIDQKAFVYAPIGHSLNGRDVSIVGRDIEKNTLSLQSSDQQIVTCNLSQKSIVLMPYKEEVRSFQKGEKIVFLKNNKRLNIQNGLSGQIQSIDQFGNLSVKTKDQEIDFNIKQYPYVDHAYGVSIHKSQGMTTDSVMPLFHSKNRHMNNTESAYVAFSRMKDRITLYTDDDSKIIEQIKDGQKKTSTFLFENDKEQLTIRLDGKKLQGNSIRNTKKQEMRIEI